MPATHTQKSAAFRDLHNRQIVPDESDRASVKKSGVMRGLIERNPFSRRPSVESSKQADSQKETEIKITIDLDYALYPSLEPTEENLITILDERFPDPSQWPAHPHFVCDLQTSHQLRSKMEKTYGVTTANEAAYRFSVQDDITGRVADITMVCVPRVPCSPAANSFQSQAVPSGKLTREDLLPVWRSLQDNDYES